MDSRRKQHRCGSLAAVLGAAVFMSPCPVHAETLFRTADGVIRVNNWTYRLQGDNAADGELQPESIAAAPHDLAVIDFARYGDLDSMFTPTEVERMRDSDPAWGGSGERKVVIAYISIGEASDFRHYWDPAWTSNGKATGDDTPATPDWLGPVNPDWPESRKVRYWNPDWQAYIFSDTRTGWLDLIVDQGFDGAYLDIVDAYEYWWYEEGERTELQAAQEMIDFVVALSAHARQTNPNFLIFPQNAPGILNVVKVLDPDRYDLYIQTISAIGEEDTYYYGDNDRNNNYNPQQDVITFLTDDFLGNGVPVFAVEYLSHESKIQQFYDEATTDGFHVFAAPKRALSKIGPVGPAPPVMNIPGDLDGNGCADDIDLAILIASYNLDAGGDIDGDGDTDLTDLATLLFRYDSGCP
ncbi:MAG: endo alpha-1,4 polygalactosaminidase [Phycisphaerales bacterium]|nr:endo alpha-1,4 polygalactosaminidase [Phycisphaerales bacterium]